MNQPGDGDMPRLELTYNFGVDSYEIGTGYGHIAITSDDLDATLARLADQGIQPEKPPYSVREGGSRLCFVRDPDSTGSRSSSSRRALRTGLFSVLRSLAYRAQDHGGQPLCYPMTHNGCYTPDPRYQDGGGS